MSTEGSIMHCSVSSGSAPGSAPESPKDKVKFLCSHGGKILPRPVDGHLKYVGGETRIISVSREIKFRELMKKLTYLIEGETVLKYQLAPEDLDALVSVRSDEDLRHMFDEYDRNESAGAPRLRAFLFPAKPIVLENHMEIHALEQRYIDAVNGFIRSSFGISPSDCASPSPRSPENNYPDNTTTHEPIPNNHHSHRSHMYRVQSSPSIYNLNGYQQSNKYSQPHSYSCYQNTRPPHHQSHHSKPPFDPYKSVGPERLVTVRSVGRVEGSRHQQDQPGSRYQVDQTQPGSRYQVDQNPSPPHYSCTKHSRGSGSCSKCMHYDEYSSWSDRRTEKGCSLPPSPLSLSPRSNSHIVMKPWDSAITEDS